MFLGSNVLPMFFNNTSSYLLLMTTSSTYNFHVLVCFWRTGLRSLQEKRSLVTKGMWSLTVEIGVTKGFSDEIIGCHLS